MISDLVLRLEWILAIMPKYGNSAPGRKFLIFMEMLLNFASNKPSTTTRH